MAGFFSNLWNDFAKAYEGFENRMEDMFRGKDFSGYALPLDAIANEIDPRFVPRVPMSDERIDIQSNLSMSFRGFKHAKLVTEQTHPEFFAHWKTLCNRAGFIAPMQLMITESDVPQASALSATEMMVSTGLLRTLTYREVCGVLGHELAHAKNMKPHRDQNAATALGVGATAAILPFLGRTPAGARIWGHVASRVVGSSISGVVGGRAAEKINGYSSELQADFEGAIISGDPDALANALIKLDKTKPKLPFWKEAQKQINAIHPEVSERVKWLNEVKQELQAATSNPTVTSTPALRISTEQSSAERVSTNLLEAAI
ncbi:MAG: M48 family metalloprotease [Alphaproteobacteria bacterium]|nr:M48 family metalloprotease [Alphaproteobacteria bacterium]